MKCCNSSNPPKFFHCQCFLIYGIPLDTITGFTVLIFSCIAFNICIDMQHQPQAGSVMPLSVGFGFGGMVLLLVIIIIILSIILIKSRKSILSQKIDTRHYTKPPPGNCNVIFSSIEFSFAQFLHAL